MLYFKLSFTLWCAGMHRIFDCVCPNLRCATVENCVPINQSKKALVLIALSLTDFVHPTPSIRRWTLIC